MPAEDQVFKGNLVTLSIRDRIDPAKIPAEFTPDKMVELRQHHVAERLARELTKHFLKIATHEGQVEVSMSITLLVNEVPPGLAHTKIVFMEAP